jgi:3-hydroxy acid dehydrogenase / malonic semialdehyde reductase
MTLHVFRSGSSAGIGRSCAFEFAKYNCHLILCARRYEKLEELKSELLKLHSHLDVQIYQLDVSNASQVDALFQSISPPDSSRSIDILVNNAGLAKGLFPLEKNSLEDIHTVLDTNIKGTIYLTRAALGNMKTQNSGHVINVSSVAGLQCYPGGSIYCASKHAVHALTETLRMELIQTNIRVTEILPGKKIGCISLY